MHTQNLTEHNKGLNQKLSDEPHHNTNHDLLKTVKLANDNSSIARDGRIAGITASVIAKPRYRRIRGDTKRAPVTVITISMAEMRVYGQK